MRSRGRQAGNVPRICVVSVDTTGGAPGGMATSTQQLVGALSARGVTVITLTNFVDGSVWKRAAAAVKCLFEVGVICRVGDVVHIQVATGLSIERDLCIALLARAKGSWVICQFHGAGQVDDWVNGNRVHRWAYRRLTGIADRTFALGPATATRLQKMVKDPGSVRVVGNCVDVPEVAAVIRDEGVPIIACIGRVGERKGSWDLVIAAEGLVRSGHNFRLVFAGDGETAKLKRVVEASKELRGRVTVMGWAGPGEVDALLRSARVVVLPSYKEGLPMVLLEAMARGIPVVASCVGEVADLLSEGGGLMVPSGDVSGVEAAIAMLLESPQLAREMGALGRDVVRGRFSTDIVIGKAIEEYRSVAGCS